MFDVSRSEILFYGGILLMTIAVMAGAACGLIFRSVGRKINRELEKEYGETGSTGMK